jgi:hypothetical protein
MTLNWLYKLSDWNPQFFREVKGRLTSRTFKLAAIASVLAQLMLLACFGMDIPTRQTDPLLLPQTHHRCTGPVSGEYSPPPTCLLDGAGNLIINWQGWWADVFQALAWSLPFVLLMAGVYMLIGDLGKEERRGTLNFIRLSPQRSQSILLGKLLGVPILSYLFVGLALPLHLLAAAKGGISPLAVVSLYLVTIATCGFFYTAALLYGSMSGFQGWVGAIAIWFSYSVFWQIWQTTRYTSRPLVAPIGYWFHLEIGQSLGLVLPFSLVTLGIGTFWIWRSVNRRFRNPTATLMGKGSSYLATTSISLFLVGFALRPYESWDRPIETLGLIGCLQLIWFGLLIAALSPHRQSLLDWARFRRERVSQSKRGSRSLLGDLLWGEKSPALLAIGANLGIAMAITTPWILTWGTRSGPGLVRTFASLVLGATFMLICAVIAQIMLMMKSPKRAIWAVGAVGALFVLPPIGLSVLTGGGMAKHAALWMFTPYAFAAINSASIVTILLGLVGQLSTLILLTARLSRQLQKAGESESKALLAGV